MLSCKPICSAPSTAVNFSPGSCTHPQPLPGADASAEAHPEHRGVKGRSETEVISLELQLQPQLPPLGHNKPLSPLWAQAGGGFGATKSLHHPPKTRHGHTAPLWLWIKIQGQAGPWLPTQPDLSCTQDVSCASHCPTQLQGPSPPELRPTEPAALVPAQLPSICRGREQVAPGRQVLSHVGRK